jgi:hypothetical protein
MKWCAAEPGAFTYFEFETIPDLRCTSNSAFTRVGALLRCTASRKCVLQMALADEFGYAAPFSLLTHWL